MNYENFKTGFNKPTIITAQQYGTKVSVEIDHSDTDIDQLFDAFQTLIVGLGYHESAWKGWIVERAAEYQEEENEKWEDNEDEIIFHKEVKDAIKNGLAKVNEEEENEFFGEWDDETYRATEEDEDEFDDYGQIIPPNQVLIDAKKQYDTQLKMDAKKKNKK